MQTPAAPVLKRQSKKRKDAPVAEGDAGTETQRADVPPVPPKRTRPNTSVFVSGLPLDASLHEIADVFARYGVLLEDDDGKPRVKMYHDESTKAFKGEALVVYFKPESVDLAIQLLDDTPLRANTGAASGPPMRVQRAEFHEAPHSAADERRDLSDADKKSIRRRMNRMHKYVRLLTQQNQRLGLGQRRRTLAAWPERRRAHSGAKKDVYACRAGYRSVPFVGFKAGCARRVRNNG